MFIARLLLRYYLAGIGKTPGFRVIVIRAEKRSYEGGEILFARMVLFLNCIVVTIDIV